MAVRQARFQRNRRKLQSTERQDAGLQGTILTAEFTTPNIVLTFPAPVVLVGIPQYLTNTGKLPTSATLSTDKMTVTLGYDTPGAVTSFTVKQGDPAIHTFTGGSVPAGTFLAS